MPIAFGHIELFVRDTLASRDFYHDILGFDVEEVQNDTFVWLRSGSMLILLRPGEARAAATDYQHSEAALVLYTSDVTASAALLRSRGLTFLGTDGSDQCLTFTDPDGHWFQLADPAG